MSAAAAAPALEHLLDMHVDLEPVQAIPTPGGLRATFVATGGTFAGPRVSGTVVPGGGDWILVGSDGVGRLDVRGTLRLDDGTLAHWSALGASVIDADQRAAWLGGARVPAEESYVRTTPRIEVDPTGPHAWLNAIVCVGVNELVPGGIDYRVFRVL